MLTNYIKIALRNMLKAKGYSAINILGLAVGLACCLLIVLFISDELSYDTHYANGDRLYRVYLNARINNKDFVTVTTNSPLAAAMMKEIPEVETAGRLYSPGNFTIRYGEKIFNEERMYFADPTMLDIFSVTVRDGDVKNFDQPNMIILSESMAKKYFSDENPIGKVLRLDGKTDYKVIAVYNDVPGNAHLHFDFLASLTNREEGKSTQWLSNNFSTYTRLKPGASTTSVESKMHEMVMRYGGPELKRYANKTFEQFFSQGGAYAYHLQPIRDIHLYSNLENEQEPGGDITYVYIFSGIAIFILLVACVNFMNLATARSAGRAKEVGIRKVLGSERGQLIRLFLIESLVITTLAMIIAVLLAEMALPFFNELSGKSLDIGIATNPLLGIGLALAVLLVGVLAGTYPAFYLTAYQPIAVLKGAIASGVKNSRLRDVLVVFQFCVSIILIAGTIIVYQQLQYVQNRNLGFQKEQILVIHNVWQMNKQGDAFKQSVLRTPGVASASLTSTLPGHPTGNSAFQIEGDASNEPYLLWQVRTDFDFLKTMGINMSQGRDFSMEHPSDSSAIIINEAAVRLMNMPQPLGKRLTRFSSPPYEIVGVTQDFNFQSLRNPVRPISIFMNPPGFPAPSFLAVRVKPDHLQETIQSIGQVWNQFQPGEPYVYTFLDEDFGNLYRTEERAGTIVTTFSSLAIFIACLGLLGLAAFATERRTKEIGIRKVLGASEGHIIGMICKEFVLLVTVALVISVPIAYYVMNRWLQDFAYRIDIGADVFILSGVIALTVALLTVSYTAIRAALSNPVNALKYE
ncbi:ABC transporter permease [bacterium]|nr:ABC transporter permease [bacterium]NUN45441.1 ABC transporter permease [bacterium]